MMDYMHVRDDGVRVPVSEMTDGEISECLADGVRIISGPLKPERLAERLRIEQLIRMLEL